MEQFTMSMTADQMLQSLKDYAVAEGGFCFHIRDARGQDVEGMPDALVLIPRSFQHPGIIGLFEIKSQTDTVTVLQEQVLLVAETATEVVSGIIRPVPKKPLLEITLDDALELLGKDGGDYTEWDPP
jgi:hypothetical protein